MRPCCAFAAALLLAACSSGRPAPTDAAPTAWAAALCGGLGPLVADQKVLTARVSSEARTLVSRPAVSRAVLVRALNAVRVDFTSAVSVVDGVGPPAVPAGPAIQAHALAGLRQGEALYAAATSRLQSTAANGPALVAALNGVRDDLAAGGGPLNAAFDGLDAQDRSGRLTRALQREPTCAGITR